MSAVDWPARFRAAAEAVERKDWDAAAHVFGALAVKAEHYPHEVEAIGRALLGDTLDELERLREVERRARDEYDMPVGIGVRLAMRYVLTGKR